LLAALAIQVQKYWHPQSHQLSMLPFKHVWLNGMSSHDELYAWCSQHSEQLHDTSR
jgi:hypothetical protein